MRFTSMFRRPQIKEIIALSRAKVAHPISRRLEEQTLRFPEEEEIPSQDCDSSCLRFWPASPVKLKLASPRDHML